MYSIYNYKIIFYISFVLYIFVIFNVPQKQSNRTRVDKNITGVL